ncbi:MAG: glycosyltransferase family 2 protein [Nitrosopumilaceae archaeon]
MDIVIGIPAYNEEKNIAAIILKLKKITEKIIVCNDGSTDLTEDIASKLGAIVINHETNMGYGSAIRSLFQKAKELGAEILVTFDADGQHRTNDIKTVIEPILKNQTDIVIGSRFLDIDDKVPEYRKFGIKVITKVTNASINQKLTDSQSGFRAYTKKVLSEINPSEYGMGVSTEILIKASSKGFKIVEVPIKVLYDGKTSTHNPVSHGTSVLFSTMKFTSIEHPLQFYGIPGIVLSGIGLFFIVWIIQYFADFGNFPPVLALIAIGTTILGAVFLVTAIILYSLVNVVREGSRK